MCIQSAQVNLFYTCSMNTLTIHSVRPSVLDMESGRRDVGSSMHRLKENKQRRGVTEKVMNRGSRDMF